MQGRIRKAGWVGAPAAAVLTFKAATSFDVPQSKAEEHARSMAFFARPHEQQVNPIRKHQNKNGNAEKGNSKPGTVHFVW
jgi:hypothetical protein